MTGQNVSITEAARNFSDFVNRVAYRGESFFLIRGKRRVASLKPANAVVSVSDLQQALMDLPALEAPERKRWLADLAELRDGEKQ
ncbi:MAG: type II toxin-antitoxin system Phd/YefM family antitoxin [Gammaproteobacteria bacterium]|nr:type II toxin-antitoxin system Phd/YefM family antitoxin [Gammaproteobacteria bacterium]